MSRSVVRVAPQQYVHVRNINKNVTELRTGPLRVTLSVEEEVVRGPEPYTVLPPATYVIVRDPVAVDKKGNAVLDEHGQAVLRFGHCETRVNCEPFPLYPGESIISEVTPIVVVKSDSALHVRAKQDLEDYIDEVVIDEEDDNNEQEKPKKKKMVKRQAGEEWLIRGPTSFVPNVDFIEVLQHVEPVVVERGQAVRIRAKYDLVDVNGVRRRSGEEYLVHTIGSYIPTTKETVVRVQDEIVLTQRRALHLRAIQTHTRNGVKRSVGEEYNITIDDCETYMVGVEEEIVSMLNLIVLASNEYCYVYNPFDEESQKTKFGEFQLVHGPHSFFLKPREELYLHSIYVDSVVHFDTVVPVYCTCTFEEDVIDSSGNAKKVLRKAGEEWEVYGPSVMITHPYKHVTSCLKYSVMKLFNTQYRLPGGKVFHFNIQKTHFNTREQQVAKATTSSTTAQRTVPTKARGKARK